MSRRHRIEDLRGRRTLLVASTGGHLAQLELLAPRLGLDPQGPWLTFDTEQSRSLLRGRDVRTVPYISPRDLRGALVGMVRSWRHVGEVEAVVSTGAAVALSVLPQALLRGRRVVYIESISRTRGPSLSGRILSRLPRIGLYTQHHAWSDATWRPGPSVLSAYRAQAGPPREVRRILVTLGTIAPYRFDRLVDLVLAALADHPDAEVTWQLGATERSDLPGRVETMLSAEELAQEMERVDLVIAHAGVGVAMGILDAGRVPVLLDRRPELDEHVDDHQRQILQFLTERGLAADAEDVLTDPARARAIAGTAVSAAAPGEIDADAVWTQPPGRELRVIQAGPSPETRGGMGLVADILAAALAEHPEQVRLRTLDSGGAAQRWPALRFLRAAATVAWAEHDVLHLHLASRGSTLRKGILALIARARHRPYVLHVHGGGYPDWFAGSSPLIQALVRRLFSHAARVVTLGHAWSRWAVTELGVDAARVITVPNGVPARAAGPLLADGSERPDAEGGQILFVGSLSSAKGADQLCEALAELLTDPRWDSWSAVLMGAGADDATGRAIAALRDRVGERLQTPGALDDAARDACYARSDLLVLPSRTEGLPLVMLEAMSAGVVPVIANVGAVGEVLHDGTDGILLPPGATAEQIRAALTPLLADAGLRRTLARAARRTWEESFTHQAMAGPLVDAWAGAALEEGRR